MNTSLPLSLIAAHAENRVIGIDNSMPWHLPGDFKYFKATTLGKPIIMGRKTWDSLGRPLPGRLNIVVSRQPGLQLQGAEVFGSLEQALVRAEQWAREKGVDELMLIGGAQLYGQALEKGLVCCYTTIGRSPFRLFFPVQIRIKLLVDHMLGNVGFICDYFFVEDLSREFAGFFIFPHGKFG